MVSGPDVITYIGVPLAVAGVAPIIYNTVSTLLVLAKVRRALNHGRLAAITRGDIINHVIEVVLARYTLAPLDRTHERDDYWRLCDHPSNIPGGTWTIFNWKTNTIGMNTQRIDYSDQLRQPQAEIGFEELVSFLLDLGAVPAASGFRMLRASGLWVPTGTPLLVSPDGHDPVLTIAPLDDSDGHLSLAVRWSSHWNMRDADSLPPYWVRLRGLHPTQPPSQKAGPEDGEKAEDDIKKDIEPSSESSDSNEKTPANGKYTPDLSGFLLAIKCQIGVEGLKAAIVEHLEAEETTGDLEIGHLEGGPSALNPNAAMWFASAMTAFGTTSQTILWNYRIPAETLAFSKKDSIPCGILVLMGVVEESATPEWATKYPDDAEEEREATFQRMRDESRAQMAEARMGPAERAAAFRERTQRKHEAWVAGLNASRRRDAQRAETRITEAMQSPKWTTRLVAERNLAWLQREGHVGPDANLKRVAESLLWRMVREPAVARDLAAVLDGWKAFVDNGGIRRAEYEELSQKQVLFAQASIILALIEHSVSAEHGTLAMDLQECLRIWKKVRLG